MRDIAGDFFSRSPAMAGPLVALVLFFIVFVAVAIRVLRARADQFEGEAALPLSDGERATSARETTDLGKQVAS